MLELSMPAVVSMLISSLYNMAYTNFVGKIDSASASGAVGVAMPVMSLTQAVGFMFGHYSGNYMSRALGPAIMAVGLPIPTQLCGLLGAIETIAPYARNYLLYLMPGAPFLVTQLVINNQLRFQSSAFIGMIGVTAGRC